MSLFYRVFAPIGAQFVLLRKRMRKGEKNAERLYWKYRSKNFFQIRCNIFHFDLLIDRAGKTIVSGSCVRHPFHLQLVSSMCAGWKDISYEVFTPAQLNTVKYRISSN